MSSVARQIVVAMLTITWWLAGCASVPKVPELTPLQPGANPRPVTLKKVIAKPRRGTRIGNIYGGLAHVWQTHLVWKGGRVAFDPEEYHNVLREQFEANGYAVVGDPDALFEDPSEWRAEYLIGALIKDIKVDLWYPWCGYGNWNTGSGKGYVEVNWQVYGRRTRSVELGVTTKGSAHKVKITDLGPDEPIIQAFGAAARNLLANKEFVDLVAPTDDARTKTEMPQIPIALVRKPPEGASPEAIIDRCRISVLTVFAGDLHGSGFIVSKDGYVLTNQHVVGNAKTVTAKTLTGRELIGEVIRVDRIRDVALVKLEEDLYQPLVLGESSLVRPGSEVYAVGSPFDEEFGQSVTRGVVSGFRSQDDQRFIQSDATVHPGNSGGPLLSKEGVVVGIAVSGVVAGGAGVNINLFIPIEDALSTLHISEPGSTGAEKHE